jgi:hypothetical protein
MKRKAKSASKGPTPPTWLRKDCRARWRELLSQYGTDLRPHELETLARMAHCSVDLEAAEAAAGKCGTIVTGENGIAYIHPAIKHRNALATEFRMLLKMISTKKTAAVGGKNPEMSVEGILARIQALRDDRKTAAERQTEARTRMANLSAQDFNREQQAEHANIVPLRKGG